MTLAILTLLTGLCFAQDTEGTEIEPHAEIEIAFCFVNYKRPMPNETVYAKDRAAAKAKVAADQVWCHDGPCLKQSGPPDGEQCKDEE